MTSNLSRRTILSGLAAAGASTAALTTTADDDDDEEGVTLDIGVAQTERMREAAAQSGELGDERALDVFEVFGAHYFADFVENLDGVSEINIERHGTVDTMGLAGGENDPQSGRGVAPAPWRLMEFSGVVDEEWSDHANLLIDTPHWDSIVGVAFVDDFSVDSNLGAASLCDYGRYLLDVEDEELADPPSKVIFSDPSDVDPDDDNMDAIDDVEIDMKWMVVTAAVHEVLHNLGLHHHEGDVIYENAVPYASPIMGPYAGTIGEDRCGIEQWEPLNILTEPIGFRFEAARCELESLATNLRQDEGRTSPSMAGMGASDEFDENVHISDLPEEFAYLMGAEDVDRRELRERLRELGH